MIDYPCYCQQAVNEESVNINIIVKSQIRGEIVIPVAVIRIL